MTDQLRPPQPFSEAGIRKVLQRARDKFAELLLEETSRSIQNTSLEAVEEELRELGFWPYCHAAVKKRRE